MLDGCHLSSFVHRAASGALYGPEGLFDISRSCLTLGSFLKPISFSIPIPNSKQCDKQILEQTDRISALQNLFNHFWLLRFGSSFHQQLRYGCVWPQIPPPHLLRSWYSVNGLVEVSRAGQFGLKQHLDQTAAAQRGAPCVVGPGLASGPQCSVHKANYQPSVLVLAAISPLFFDNPRSPQIALETFICRGSMHSSQSRLSSAAIPLLT